MRYRRLDPNGDYSAGQGRQNFITGVEAVAQAIGTRLRLLQEEWWEDQLDGLPLYQQILGKFGPSGNKEVVDLLIKERILGTENVAGIINFTSEYNAQTRRYTCQCSVSTAFGAVELTPFTLGG